MPPQTREHGRLVEKEGPLADWRHWGPYVSERAWGTVREDYSADGNAWGYVPARRTPARGPTAGAKTVSPASATASSTLCLRVRASGTSAGPLPQGAPVRSWSGPEGNHGEDAKEFWFFLDATCPATPGRPCSTSTPTRVSPTRSCCSRTGVGTRSSPSSSWRTPACSPATATTTCRSPTPRLTTTTCSCASPSPIGAPKPPSCTCCRRSGSGTPGIGATPTGRRATCPGGP
jgi:hypothetical protein